MIDVHAHVFNLGYVPVQGILESRGLGRDAARPLARLLLDALEQDESLPGAFADAFAAAIDPARAEAGEGALLHETIDAFAGSVSSGFLHSHANDLEVALRALGSPPSAGAASADDSLRLLGEQGLRDALRRLLTQVAQRIADGAALLQWFLLMLSRETELIAVLRRAWPESRLFVHHMMDMDNHYPNGRSLYPFAGLQLRRMRALVQAHHGRLLTFVAFDPFRADGVSVVEEALHAGCAGVKFYPPNGFRPLGNTATDLEGTDQLPEVVDGRNLALFRMCVRLGVPVFTHCSPGGMESRPKKNSGCLSDPRGWERVLQTDGLRELRLCLGHAGGDDGWCAAPGTDERNKCNEPFVARVIDLCVNFPNVYCEFGHTEAIFRASERAHFATRLGDAVQRYGDRFGRKILYGSDWHLLARTPGFARFDDIFREMFDVDSRLRPFASGFFVNNALEYLNLSAYIERNDGALSVEEKAYLRSLQAGL